MLKILALALAGAFALATTEAPAEAREPTVKKRQQAPPPTVPGGSYAVRADPRMPYGGPGRAQFEPVVVGPQPERAEGRNPEGP